MCPKLGWSLLLPATPPRLTGLVGVKWSSGEADPGVGWHLHMHPHTQAEPTLLLWALSSFWRMTPAILVCVQRARIIQTLKQSAGPESNQAALAHDMWKHPPPPPPPPRPHTRIDQDLLDPLNPGLSWGSPRGPVFDTVLRDILKAFQSLEPPVICFSLIFTGFCPH